MFTGIIEGLCEVKSATGSAATLKLKIELDSLSEGCKAGDSLSVNGVCLTVTSLENTAASFDVSGETLSKSNLGGLRAGSKVNIERSLKADSRFGGHFVLGHTDGTATIKKIERKGQFSDMTFAADKKLLDDMIIKGSIAVDGISLTVAELDDNSFRISLIPQTLKSTTLGAAKVGDKVNIETDVIIKTIKKYVEKFLPAEGLTAEKLKNFGF
jgi:riboflavin synthase